MKNIINKSQWNSISIITIFIQYWISCLLTIALLSFGKRSHCIVECNCVK